VSSSVLWFLVCRPIRSACLVRVVSSPPCQFRDSTLMANFTCNEHMMVMLLDANYVEYLENSALNTPEQLDAQRNRTRGGTDQQRCAEMRREELTRSVCVCVSSDASVLPQLLTALLMKDYNVALVRAVCNKIIINQIQYDGFIPALIALAKVRPHTRQPATRHPCGMQLSARWLIVRSLVLVVCLLFVCRMVVSILLSILSALSPSWLAHSRW
jgi:hypothetical protein